MPKNVEIVNEEKQPQVSWDELTEGEKAEFDYLLTPEEQQQAEFIRYRGVVYNLSEFMTTRGLVTRHPVFDKWQGYVGDSFYSGIVIRWSEDGDIYIATYIS